MGCQVDSGVIPLGLNWDSNGISKNGLQVDANAIPIGPQVGSVFGFTCIPCRSNWDSKLIALGFYVASTTLKR